MFRVLITLLVISFQIECISNEICADSCQCRTNCNLCRNGSVTILCMRNMSHSEMGYVYGSSLKEQLVDTLDVLKKYYSTLNVEYKDVVAKADMFYQRYTSVSYRNFLKGMSQGSGLSFEECKILNGMETIGTPSSNATADNRLEVGCAYVYIPPARSTSKMGIIGRNYDFGPPFQDIADKNLVVTVIVENEKIPTAIIGMPGQIYCPTCINSENVFVEFNNGEPSGGWGPVQSRETLLLGLVEKLQNSDSFDSMSKQMYATESDYSLIVNVADDRKTESYEFSKSNGMKPFIGPMNETFVSTNYFLNQSWNLPPPRNADTWIGVTRRENLISLFNKTSMHVDDVKSAMDVSLEDGGANWVLTIYQIVYDMNSKDLFVRAPKATKEWTNIKLRVLFDNVNGEIHAETCKSEL